MICAALLHDVVEDTKITSRQIWEQFGSNVSNYVYWLTDKSRPSDGNRKVRKEIDRDHISSAPAEAKTIKLADLICNTRSIVAHDPKFAKVYLEEKGLLLNVLKEGNAHLYELARNTWLRGLEGQRDRSLDAK